MKRLIKFPAILIESVGDYCIDTIDRTGAIGLINMILFAMLLATILLKFEWYEKDKNQLGVATLRHPCFGGNNGFCCLIYAIR